MKNKKLIERILIIIAAIVLVIAGLFIFKNQATAPSQTEENIQTEARPSASENNQLANPASVNCENLGGEITIKTRSDGGQYGVCEFGEGMACEEWALYKGNCPAGGVDISGLETDEQKYCLWLGGKLTQSSNTCTLPDKETCDVETLYSGTCPAN